jgi:site-specific recombinase XerD
VIRAVGQVYPYLLRHSFATDYLRR